ncbi:MAG: TonB family protein [Holophagae bacterium]|nr:TonB family protein [Holophagae bacterium]
MARIGINIIIEKRKMLENGGRTFSAISVLLHIIVGLIVVVGVLTARSRSLREPKVYRVSIATLSTASNPNMEQKKTTAVSEKPISKPSMTPEPVRKTSVNQKTQKTEKKAAAGVNTTKPEKKSTTPRQEETVRPTPGGGGPKRVGFGGRGSIVDMDGANFEYAYYLSIVQDRIGSNWVRTYVGKGKVKVYFRINRNGNIVGAMIEESSGDVGLDRLALRAITASSPLPPLPEGYTGNNLGIHIWFNYEE